MSTCPQKDASAIAVRPLPSAAVAGRDPERSAAEPVRQANVRFAGLGEEPQHLEEAAVNSSSPVVHPTNQ